MKLRWRTAVFGAALVVAVPIATWDAASTVGDGGPRTNLTILVPGSAGGGYDSLARESQQVLRTNGISGNVQVVNVPGASGTVGLQTLVEMEDRDDAVLVLGAAMVGGIEVTRSEIDLGDVTPLAAVTNDFPIVVLPGDSPYPDAASFLEAWAADPQGHPIGGGALGNVDHLAVIALAEAAGLDPAEINYIPYSGGGEVISAMLSGTVTAGVSGYGELADQIATGRLTGLGVASPEPIDGIDLPTFEEQGIDVVVSNWRGFVAPPGVSDAQREDLVAMLEEMLATPEWSDVLRRQQWQEQVMTGSDLTDFIDAETIRTQELLERAAR